MGDKGRCWHCPTKLERLGESALQELAQLGRSFELRDRVQFLERRRERVGETPDRPWPEILILRFEVQVMQGPGQVLWRFQLALYESFVDDYLGSQIRQFGLLPDFDLLAHGLEIALHSIHADGYAVNQRERLRVLR